MPTNLILPLLEKNIAEFNRNVEKRLESVKEILLQGVLESNDKEDKEEKDHAEEDSKEEETAKKLGLKYKEA